MTDWESHRSESIDIPSYMTQDSRMEDLVRELIHRLGEDPDREGLFKTPKRVIASLKYLTHGYKQDIHKILNGAVFEENYDEMVVLKDIDVFSLCEHHLLPFYGKAHVAYIPKGKIIGLSKIPRVVEVFARRLQVQERLTSQIADCLMNALNPRGVGVVIEAVHLCMAMRGVEKRDSYCLTSAMLGSFRESERVRGEFLSLIGKRA
ncbi:MAG: GTP cyclohydrolase I FolE [Candidatus Omnitrophica bacterium]|nr:GTP cyclohydrolase I FolE [Candidatus Omnitrophota bacterium]